MKDIHIGVYGIYIFNGKVLLIKKSRGPYNGMFDLPGGGIEESETVSECLKRELLEEVNGNLLDSNFLGFNEYHAEYIGSNNQLKRIDHIGLYYNVTMNISQLKTGFDGHDSLGAEWVELSLLENFSISPIAKPMILKAIQLL